MLEQRDNEAMTEDELVAMYLLILFGGSETTTNLLGNGFLGAAAPPRPVGPAPARTRRWSAARSTS